MTTMPNNLVKKSTKLSVNVNAKSLIACLLVLLTVSVAGFAKPNTKPYSPKSSLIDYQKTLPYSSKPVQHSNKPVQDTVKLADTKHYKNINPRVLQLALKAHHKARAMGAAKNHVVTIIDYSLPSTARRMWVLDLAKQKVIYNTLVAHGSGSGGNIANRFSDVPGSLQTSLGVFVTGSTYQGKHGLSLTLHGLEKGINGNAASRRIVIHGANYVSDGAAKGLGRLGRSWGCPALDHKISTPVINTIKNGSMVFAYYPDSKWLNHSKFL